MGVVCPAEVPEQVHYLCVGSVIQNRVMNLCGMNTECNVRVINKNFNVCLCLIYACA